MEITSISNPKIKSFLKLRNARVRKAQDVFILEGVKEIKLAVENNYVFNKIFYCPEIISENEFNNLFRSKLNEIETYSISKKVFARMVYRDTSGGIVAEVKRKSHLLSNVTLSGNPFVLVIENVEKPGNLGAVIRTADAAGIDTVIFCDSNTDVYNPNIIRASLGCIFNISFAVSDSLETIKWLKNQNVNIVCTSLSGNIPYHNMNYSKPIALVIGSETKGLDQIWLENADKTVFIPMFGQADSLNASVSAAILLYEVLRQRNI